MGDSIVYQTDVALMIIQIFFAAVLNTEAPGCKGLNADRYGPDKNRQDGKEQTGHGYGGQLLNTQSANHGCIGEVHKVVGHLAGQ